MNDVQTAGVDLDGNPGNVLFSYGADWKDDENNVLGYWLFQFSGARVNGHFDHRYPGNELRIRYQDLARLRGTRAKKTEIDSVAAQLILEQYFDEAA